MNRGYVNGGERKVFHKNIDDVGGVQLKKVVIVSLERFASFNTMVSRM
jgi:hypothetical protein